MVRSSSPTLDLSDPRTYATAREVFYGGMIRPLTARCGLDEDEAFQECLTRLLAKQRLPGSRFDPSRSSLRTYLFKVFRSVLLNVANTQKRRWGRQSVTHLASGHARLRGWSIEVDEVAEDVDADTWGKRPQVQRFLDARRDVRENGIFADGSVW